MSDFIQVIGAKIHNLKNISVSIPKNKLVVITGISGSGKSSLAFDTIYAEGQKKYLESLSTYTRMLISSGSEDTQVESIKGLSPTISISQKTVSHNPRSTVGTITEIYDFYRLLFLRIGKQKCLYHDEILKKHTTEDILQFIRESRQEKFFICVPLSNKETKLTFADIQKKVVEKGFVRFLSSDIVYGVGDEYISKQFIEKEVFIIIDRLTLGVFDSEETLKRLRDSISAAWQSGEDFLAVYFPQTKQVSFFSQTLSCPFCRYTGEILTLSSFSFNFHQGACPKCHGLGSYPTFLEDHVVNKKLTLEEGAVLPWMQMKFYEMILIRFCQTLGIPVDIPYGKLSPEQKKLVLYGIPESQLKSSSLSPGKKQIVARYEGIMRFLERRYREGGENEATFKRITPFLIEKPCEACEGHRLRPESLRVYVGEKHIGQIAAMSVKDALSFFQKLFLSPQETELVQSVIKNIRERLEFLQGVGLEYISIARKTLSLSGGESQRIRLASQIGTQLEGIIYVLDEPSIGLHSKDNKLLIAHLKKLVDTGNSVIVVEHDEEIMQQADYIIDIGPWAGKHGGNVVFSGTYPELLKNKPGETGLYISGQKVITIPRSKVKPTEFIEIIWAKENNLKDIQVKIPLGLLTVVTGVSGSGKSSLIIDTLAPYLHNHFNRTKLAVGEMERIEGIDNIDKFIVIDQSPIGRTPHSNVATYTGLFTPIRELFAETVEAKRRGYKLGRFSFNTKGGRCEICEGAGVKKIEMYFLPDMYVTCDACRGTRFNEETLSVKWKGKNVADILDMTVDDACDFFVAFPKIHRILDLLKQVGLGYITLGQPAPTFSWGEAQRIKLAFELAKRSTTKTLYILDEPTTGLHFSDIQKLLNILHELRKKGNSVLVIEHNLDVIANADYIIDLGPNGGNDGGNVCYQWPLEGLVKAKNSHTGVEMKAYLAHKATTWFPKK